MKIQPALAALSLSALVALGAGCAQDDAAEEGVVAETTATNDSVIEPVVGADPAAGTAATAAAAGTTATGDRSEFGTWDANNDGMLDNNEFRTRFNDGGWYGDWDGDRSGTLTNEEFGTANTSWGTAPEGVETNGLFESWDADKNGQLVGDEAANGAFSVWDRDRNNTIDTNEFNAGVNWFGR